MNAAELSPYLACIALLLFAIVLILHLNHRATKRAWAATLRADRFEKAYVELLDGNKQTLAALFSDIAAQQANSRRLAAIVATHVADMDKMSVFYKEEKPLEMKEEREALRLHKELNP